MKWLTSSIALLITLSTAITADAQPQLYKIKAVYSSTVQSDSTDTLTKRRDDMILFLSDSGSVFKSSRVYQQDSLDNAPSKQKFNGTVSFNLAEIPVTGYTVIKKLGDEISFADFVAGEKLEYVHPKNIFHWQISEEIKDIAGYRCQKAMTSYAGREWIAWFANELAISDGPYKFNGLPGLIFEIEDIKNQYSFKLYSLSNANGTIFQPLIPSRKVSKEKFFESIKTFNENRFEMMSMNVKVIRGEDNVRRRAEEKSRKNNNPLELKLTF